MLNAVYDEANADAEDGCIQYQCFRHNANVDIDVNVMYRYMYEGPLAIDIYEFQSIYIPSHLQGAIVGRETYSL